MIMLIKYIWTPKSTKDTIDFALYVTIARNVAVKQINVLKELKMMIRHKDEGQVSRSELSPSLSSPPAHCFVVKISGLM